MEKSCEKAGESGIPVDGGGEDADDKEESVSEILDITICCAGMHFLQVDSNF